MRDSKDPGNRPENILIRMRPRDWQDLDELMRIGGAPSRSEAMRSAVRAELNRLRRQARLDEAS